MAAIAADVFHVAAAAGHVSNAVAAEDADRGMRDVRHLSLCLQKRVAAVARELAIPVAIRDDVHVVAEEPAEIPNLLVEDGGRAVRIFVSFEKQR